MSATAAWDLAPAPARVRSAGPRLVLVPTEDTRATPRLRLRLTRCGRLVATAFCAVALVAAVALFWGSGSAATIDHATIVQPGQTLSEIAEQQLPQLDMHDAVVSIQLANNLPSSQVRAGQSLLIPADG